MLPSLPTLYSPVTDVVYETTPPPFVSDQLAKGGFALRKLKNYCDEMHMTNMRYTNEINAANAVIRKTRLENENMAKDLYYKNDKIAKMRQRDAGESRYILAIEEAERLLMEETKARISSDEQLALRTIDLKHVNQSFVNFRLEVEDGQNSSVARDELIESQALEINQLREHIESLNFDLNEVRVTALKFERRHDEIAKIAAVLQQQKDQLIASEATFKDENFELQKRLREFIDSNREVTSNYQIVKKNYDTKKHEIQELTMEIEEAKNACQALIKQKKQLQTDLAQNVKAKTEGIENISNLEAVVIRKEAELTDAMNKLSETIGDYELKLESKDEQIWTMSYQMNEENQKHQDTIKEVQLRATEKKLEAVIAPVEHAAHPDIEKKWQLKERTLINELEKALTEVSRKESQLKALADKNQELTKRQFKPRMEVLKYIERDVRDRMLEYALAEERMETGFMCPKDLKFFKQPVTLAPCGHTFCKDCVKDMREENYNILKCEVCNVVADATYRNEQIESICEQFALRRNLTIAFHDW